MTFFSTPRYQMRKNILKKILRNEECEGKRLLEIGYGAGEIFATYQKLGMKVEGYDFSELAYECVKNNYEGQGIVLYKMEPEHRGQYDYVVACEVLEHIENDVETLKEWKKYLNINGKMIISVPAHKGRWGESDIYHGHYRRYERKELLEKFAQAGMSIEAIYTYDFPACLLLDGLRDKNRGKKIKGEEAKRDKEVATKSSGIDRDYGIVVPLLSHPVLWYPIIKFEELFYNCDYGSAYILIAKTDIKHQKERNEPSRIQ